MSKEEVGLKAIPEVQKLIQLGQQNGEITYDEINEILPDKILNSDKIDDIFILINQLGIDVVEESTKRGPAALTTITPNTPAAPTKKATKSSSRKSSSSEDSSHVDDPIRLYLKEIGKVSLLSGDQEVDLAKKIEDGEIMIEKAVLMSTLLINDLIKNHPKVKQGKIKISEVLSVNKLYYFSSVDLKELEQKYAKHMKTVLEEDKKMAQLASKLKKLDPESKKYPEVLDAHNKCLAAIRDQVSQMGINEVEVQKLSQKIQSMVARIQDTRVFFDDIQKKYGRDLKDLKHFARKV